MSEAKTEEWFGATVAPGESTSTWLVLSETYSGAEVRVPVHVWRGAEPGPTVGVSGAIHGDEINGTGTIRHLIREKPFELRAGTLVLTPVVNIFGFERHTRYLPDRRDLNRSFPGSADGSLASRIARAFFDGVVERCDYLIDLHTAAVRRTNFPNVRADLEDPRLAKFARAFGAELILNSPGPQGSLRATASAAGCPAFILEAGECWKVEPGIVEYSVRGILNCLRALRMVEGEPEEPAYRIEVDATRWLRAKHGGFLEFHVGPGDIVKKGDPIATNTDLTGESQNVIESPRGGVVLGMTTIPSVAPGDPVCHIAFPSKGELRRFSRAVDAAGDDSLYERVRDELSRSVRVTDPDPDDEELSTE